jgi:hypothetical protein
MVIEIVDFPINSVVIFPSVFCMFTRGYYSGLWGSGYIWIGVSGMESCFFNPFATGFFWLVVQ